MVLVLEKPLLWKVVQMFYPKARWGSILFSFGDTIYASKEPAKHELVHEETHLAQMGNSKLRACYYFLRYWWSLDFRLKCEVEAYQKQWEAILADSDYKDRATHFKVALATHLSSEVYGSIISYQEAFDLLKP